MSLLHIRGAQPSKRNSGGGATKPRQPPVKLTGLHKNIHKIVNVKKKINLTSPSFGVNSIMDNKCFRFFMDNFINSHTQACIPINTPKCINFLSKYNVEFVVERTQEITNAKTLITTKTNRKKNNATFVIQIPVDFSEMLLLLILLKIDFGNMQIELSLNVGRQFEKFMYKAKTCGFKYYYDFIRQNINNKRFIVIRH